MIKDLSKRLREQRKVLNLSQTKLSERLEIHKSSVNAWETDKTQPSLKYLMRLSYIYGVTVDYLLGIQRERVLDVSGLNENDIKALNEIVCSLRANVRLTNEDR